MKSLLDDLLFPLLLSVLDGASMTDVQIGVVGVVKNGTHPGMRICVDDDSENTGGFLIFQWWEGSNGPNAQGAFDDWVETADDLRRFLGKWIIEWQSDGDSQQ